MEIMSVRRFKETSLCLFFLVYRLLFFFSEHFNISLHFTLKKEILLNPSLSRVLRAVAQSDSNQSGHEGRHEELACSV